MRAEISFLMARVKRYRYAWQVMSRYRRRWERRQAQTPAPPDRPPMSTACVPHITHRTSLLTLGLRIASAVSAAEATATDAIANAYR